VVPSQKTKSNIKLSAKTDTQHADHEGVQEGEIAADIRMAIHVRGRVKTDKKTGPGDDQTK